MGDPGSFFDPFAAVQDARFDQQNDSLPADVGFYRDLAAGADGPVLQVNVGTGRIYLELLDAGLDVDGFDLAKRSLKRLRAKATDRGLSPTVWVDDATDFDVDREYGFVYAPARAFNFLLRRTASRELISQVSLLYPLMGNRDTAAVSTDI